MKRFSIIIPAYNAQATLPETIGSIKRQTFKDYEIIVVDDCSPVPIYGKYLEGSIVIRHKENKKAGGARNTGIKNSGGQYVIFLDADDKLKEETTLERLDKLIGKEEPDLIYLDLSQ